MIFVPQMGQGDWGFVATALSSRLALLCLGIGMGCLLLLALSLRTIHRLRDGGSPLARLRTLAGDADGVATIEFTLVFPVLLFLMMILTQTTLLMGGNLFVHYSAFAAARTAIVQIPENYLSDAPNIYTHTEGGEKHDAIARSAIFAVLPVSGRMEQDSSMVVPDDVVTGLTDYYAAYGDGQPNWIDTLVADRLRYAAANTTVSVALPEVQPDDTVQYLPLGVGQTHTFAARDAVTVQVAHRFNLSTPWVNRVLFADGQQDAANGYYRDIWAEYTLTLEGIRDDMPPQPSLPRQP